MKINPQLVEFLQREMAGFETFKLQPNHSIIYLALLQECSNASLIELDSISYGSHIQYRLTAQGEIALGIPSAPDTAPTGEQAAGIRSQGSNIACMKTVFETLLSTVGKLPIDEKKIRQCLNLLALHIPDEPATPSPATREPDSTAGYMVLEGGLPLDRYSVVREENTGAVIVADIKARHTAYDVARALIDETEAIRSQLTRAQERIAALEAERGGYAHGNYKLQSTINLAYEALQPYSGEEFSLRVIKAKEILEPFADTED